MSFNIKVNPSEVVAARIKRDKVYLETLFPEVGNIEGIILRLQVEGGYNNYKSKIKDPMSENTLILRDESEAVILVFNHSTRKPKRHIFDGVNTISKFSYTNDCFIHKKCKPIDVPAHLENYIFDEEISKSSTHSYFGAKAENTDFLSRNYQQGGMMSLKEMKRHPEWKQEYECNIDIKRIHICKSCNKRSFKGCCSEYSTRNRVMLKMVIGWSTC
jgi:hypothetical protein